MRTDDACSGGQDDSDAADLGTGRLVPLKTTLETRKRDTVVEVYVTAVPIKAASGALSSIRKLAPGDGGLDFQHLRRFAKLAEVPEHVRVSFARSRSPIASVDAADEGLKLFLIVGPTSAVSLADLTNLFSATVSDVVVFTTKVPLLAPTSLDQAKTWTAQYWPTVYKKSNPFGPHPSIVSRAEDEIRDDVHKWMYHAHQVGIEACKAGFGEKVGVVIVERKAGDSKVVAIAGDARWTGCVMGERGEGGGNVTAHAVLRAIGMVAGALKQRDEESRVSSGSTNSSAGGTGRSESKFSIDSDSVPTAIGDDKSTITDDEPLDPTRSRYTFEAKTGREGLIAPRRQNLTNNPVPPTSSLTTEITGEQHEVDSTVLVAANPSGDSHIDPMLRTDEQRDGADGLLSQSVELQCQGSYDIFQDHLLLEIEKEHFNRNGNQNGYLCHDLEIYCTHEPCVMCSMAIVHSRFGRVVFQKRMERTGGMCADGELGHGLGWRKELNWTLLAWHWQPTIVADEDRCEGLHA